MKVLMIVSVFLALSAATAFKHEEDHPKKHHQNNHHRHGLIEFEPTQRSKPGRKTMGTTTTTPLPTSTSTIASTTEIASSTLPTKTCPFNIITLRLNTEDKCVVPLSSCGQDKVYLEDPEDPTRRLGCFCAYGTIRTSKFPHVGFVGWVEGQNITGGCFPLYHQGPCGKSEWLVPGRSEMGKCVARQCPESKNSSQIAVLKNKKCVQTETKDSCKGLEIMQFVDEYEPVCVMPNIEIKTIGGVGNLPCPSGYRKAADSSRCSKIGRFE